MGKDVEIGREGGRDREQKNVREEKKPKEKTTRQKIHMKKLSSL